MSACNASGDNAPVYDMGTWTGESVAVDGEPTDLTSVYPEGIWLQLGSDGTALLTLGKENCRANWLEADSSFRLTFGDMTAEGERAADDRLTLLFDDTGMECVFRKAEQNDAAQDGITIFINGENTDQQNAENGSGAASLSGTAASGRSGDPLTGSWTGRLWFEEPEGEWEDYEYRSTELTGTVTFLPESGANSEATADGQTGQNRNTGAGETEPAASGTAPLMQINLYSRYFSERVPLLTADFTEENGVLHCLNGYVMSYPVTEWGMEITLTEEEKSALRDTVIIEKPGDYGHVFTPETEDTAENTTESIPEIATENATEIGAAFFAGSESADSAQITDTGNAQAGSGNEAEGSGNNFGSTSRISSRISGNVLRLQGSCRDADGAFRYVIELTRP